MAVSLKKPEKVDLSKPESPRKLPEYTPIHLIDEEETIVNRPSSAVRSDVRLQALIGKIQSDEIISDSIPKEVDENQPYNRKRMIIGIVLAVAVVLAVSLILLNLQELSKFFEDSRGVFDDVFSFITSNSLIIAIFSASFIAFGVHLLRKVLGTFTRW